jgi:hypothetical protein
VWRRYFLSSRPLLFHFEFQKKKKHVFLFANEFCSLCVLIVAFAHKEISLVCVCVGGGLINLAAHQRNVVTTKDDQGMVSSIEFSRFQMYHSSLADSQDYVNVSLIFLHFRGSFFFFAIALSFALDFFFLYI